MPQAYLAGLEKSTEVGSMCCTWPTKVTKYFKNSHGTNVHANGREAVAAPDGYMHLPSKGHLVAGLAATLCGRPGAASGGLDGVGGVVFLLLEQARIFWQKVPPAQMQPAPAAPFSIARPTLCAEMLWTPVRAKELQQGQFSAIALWCCPEPARAKAGPACQQAGSGRPVAAGPAIQSGFRRPAGCAACGAAARPRPTAAGRPR